jgi:histidine triad (HIT) family protein
MTDPNCIFCKIASGAIPAKRLLEDEHGLAFADLNPQAPVHALVIPRAHHASLAAVPESETALLGHLLALTKRLAVQLGVDNAGYRTVINSGADGGQTVHHLHLHLLAGRAMTWPPG